MKSIECLIDGKVFTHNFPGSEKKLLAKYLKHEYKLSYENYVLQYYHNNISPTCNCGCGEKTKFFKGKYLKYVSNHKNKTKPTRDIVEKIIKNRKISLNIEKRLNNLNITKEELKNKYDEFINFKISFTELEKTVCIDKRPLAYIWKELNFIDNLETFKIICKKHQYFWQNKNNKAGGRKLLDENLLINVFFFLKKEKNKHTLKEIINKFDLPCTELVLYKRLCEKFNESKIDELLRYGNSSKPEIEFYNILKYYFGKKVNKSFKLKNKVYDYILNNKILIEFDGTYWHSLFKNIENDKLKDKIAKDNGYILFRVKEKEAKDIEILLKIKKLSDENKISPN